MRKSVSQTYFLTIATVILFGLFSMGILQIGMSIHYFTNERRQAMGTALDTMEVQAQYYADADPDHQAAVQSDALGQQLELINSTTTLYQYDEALMDIVLEEANAFFAGTRSAKDAAAILQNRAQTYISESR